MVGSKKTRDANAPKGRVVDFESDERPSHSAKTSSRHAEHSTPERSSGKRDTDIIRRLAKKDRAITMFEKPDFSAEAFINRHFRDLSEAAVNNVRGELSKLGIYCNQQVQEAVYTHHSLFLEACRGIAAVDEQVQVLRGAVNGTAAVAASLRDLQAVSHQDLAADSAPAFSTADLASGSGRGGLQQSAAASASDAMQALLLDLDVALAEHDFAGAAQLMAAGAAALTVLDRDAAVLARQCDDWTTWRALLEGQLALRQEALVVKLEVEMSRPSVSASDLRGAARTLYVLVGSAVRAGSGLLRCHTARLKEQQQALLKEHNTGGDPDNTELSGGLAQHTFLTIGAAADDLAAVFGTKEAAGREVSSLLVGWAAAESSRCAALLVTHALLPLGSGALALPLAARCTALAMTMCAALERSHGLSLAAGFAAHLWPHLEGVLRAQLQRLALDVQDSVGAEAYSLGQRQLAAGATAAAAAARTGATSASTPERRRGASAGEGGSSSVAAAGVLTAVASAEGGAGEHGLITTAALLGELQAIVRAIGPIAGPKAEPVVRRGVLQLLEVMATAMASALRRLLEGAGGAMDQATCVRLFPLLPQLVDHWQQLGSHFLPQALAPLSRSVGLHIAPHEVDACGAPLHQLQAEVRASHPGGGPRIVTSEARRPRTSPIAAAAPTTAGRTEADEQPSPLSAAARPAADANASPAAGSYEEARRARRAARGLSNGLSSEETSVPAQAEREVTSSSLREGERPASSRWRRAVGGSAAAAAAAVEVTEELVSMTPAERRRVSAAATSSRIAAVATEASAASRRSAAAASTVDALAADATATSSRRFVPSADVDGEEAAAAAPAVRGADRTSSASRWRSAAQASARIDSNDAASLTPSRSRRSPTDSADNPAVNDNNPAIAVEGIGRRSAKLAALRDGGSSDEKGEMMGNSCASGDGEGSAGARFLAAKRAARAFVRTTTSAHADSPPPPADSEAMGARPDVSGRPARHSRPPQPPPAEDPSAVGRPSANGSSSPPPLDVASRKAQQAHGIPTRLANGAPLTSPRTAQTVADRRNGSSTRGLPASDSDRDSGGSEHDRPLVGRQDGRGTAPSPHLGRVVGATMNGGALGGTGAAARRYGRGVEEAEGVNGSSSHGMEGSNPSATAATLNGVMASASSAATSATAPSPNASMAGMTAAARIAARLAARSAATKAATAAAGSPSATAPSPATLSPETSSSRLPAGRVLTEASYGAAAISSAPERASAKEAPPLNGVRQHSASAAAAAAAPPPPAPAASLAGTTAAARIAARLAARAAAADGGGEAAAAAAGPATASTSHTPVRPTNVQVAAARWPQGPDASPPRAPQPAGATRSGGGSASAGSITSPPSHLPTVPDANPSATAVSSTRRPPPAYVSSAAAASPTAPTPAAAANAAAPGAAAPAAAPSGAPLTAAQRIAARLAARTGAAAAATRTVPVPSPEANGPYSRSAAPSLQANNTPAALYAGSTPDTTGMTPLRPGRTAVDGTSATSVRSSVPPTSSDSRDISSVTAAGRGGSVAGVTAAARIAARLAAKAAAATADDAGTDRSSDTGSRARSAALGGTAGAATAAQRRRDATGAQAEAQPDALPNGRIVTSSASAGTPPAETTNAVVKGAVPRATQRPPPRAVAPADDSEDDVL